LFPVKASESIRLNKIAILFLTVTATILGIAPATLVISRFESLMFFSIVTLIVAAITISRFKSLATEKPSLLEYILGWIGAIWPAVLAGFVLLISYLIFLGGVTLFMFIATWLGFEMQLNVELIAYYISLIIAIIFSILFAWMSADTLATQLYPNKAHVKSTFYELVTYGKRRLTGYVGFALLILGGLVLAVLLTSGTFTAWWFNLGLLVYLFFVCLSPFSTEKYFDPVLPNAIKAVGKMFDAMGYQIVPSPKTGKPEIDPLLVGLDFFVHNKEHALGIVVRTPQKTKSKDSWKPSDLLRSTWALETFLQEEPDETKRLAVIPVIVFIGKDKKKWKTKEVKIIEIPKRSINTILKTDSQKKLKKRASRYLARARISHKGEDLSASKDNLNIPGGEV